MGNKNNFKVLLIFPPVWLPEAPFLSTPILTAYLKERGINVSQRDLNVEFWYHFLERNKIEEIYNLLQKKWVKLKSLEELNSYQQSLQSDIAGVIGLSLDRFIYEVEEGIIDKLLYRKIVQGVSEFHVDEHKLKNLEANIKNEVHNYHDLLYSDISYSSYVYNTNDLTNIINNESHNPYYNYFNNYALNSITDSKPAVIGLSVVAINQVVPAFTLAKIFKDKFPDIHICIGGSWCTQTHEAINKKVNLFKYIDSMIIYEGEEPLYKLCLAIQQRKSFEGIPNIYFNKDNLVEKNHEFFTIDMNKIPTPDFDGLLLEKYDSPGSLPIQSSRGCYWGKCTFCSYPALEPQYKIKHPEKLIRDFITLQTKYNARTFGFTDTLMSPGYARKLSKMILREGLKINWIILARLEEKFTPDLLELMARSGCVQVSWGLESGNDRILKLVEKSIDLIYAEKILKEAARLGIHNRVLVMYGHPTEKRKEAWQTIQFIQRNNKNINSISYNYYHPEMNTPVENIKYKDVNELTNDKRNDLSIGYHWDSSLTEKDKQEINNVYRNLSEKFSLNENNFSSKELINPIKAILNQDKNSFLTELTVIGKTEKKIFSTIFKYKYVRTRRHFEISIS